MAKFSFKKGIDVGRVVAKVAYTVISLYVGGTILTEIGNVLNGTQSPFYPGLSLIGWTVGDWPLFNATNYANSCAGGTVGNALASPPGVTTCIIATNGTGILSVVGIIAIASIVLEFVNFKL